MEIDRPGASDQTQGAVMYPKRPAYVHCLAPVSASLQLVQSTIGRGPSRRYFFHRQPANMRKWYLTLTRTTIRIPRLHKPHRFRADTIFPQMRIELRDPNVRPTPAARPVSHTSRGTKCSIARWVALETQPVPNFGHYRKVPDITDGGLLGKTWHGMVYVSGLVGQLPEGTK